MFLHASFTCGTGGVGIGGGSGDSSGGDLGIDCDDCVDVCLCTDVTCGAGVGPDASVNTVVANGGVIEGRF